MPAAETIIGWRRPGGLVDRVGRLRGKTAPICRTFTQTSLSLILAGSGQLRRGDEGLLAITAPAVFCCRPGETWRYQPAPRWDEAFVVYDSPAEDLAARLGVTLPAARAWTPGDPVGLQRIADLLIDGCTPGRPGHAAVVDRLAEAAFILACETATTAGDPAIERAAAWMHTRLALGVRIDAAAAIAGLSPAQFRRRFQARFQASPLAWLNRERLRQAEALIAEGRRVGEAAQAVGILDRRWLQRLRRR